jgi:DNA-binding MurR/RpiR family transcriptional regulator
MAGESILEELRSRAPSLPPSEGRVAAALLADPVAMLDRTIAEAAATARTSVSTVIRLCQHVGLNGFSALKLRLAREVAAAGRPVDRPAEPAGGASPLGLTGEVARALAALPVSRAAAGLPAAARVLRAAHRVLVAAHGRSQTAATDFTAQLVAAGRRVHCPLDAHAQHLAARMLGPRDACLVVSHTGRTGQTVAVAAAAAGAGAPVVALTSFAASPLADLAQVLLVAGAHAGDPRRERLASRLVHLCVLDALAEAVGGAGPPAPVDRPHPNPRKETRLPTRRRT